MKELKVITIQIILINKIKKLIKIMNNKISIYNNCLVKTMPIF